MNIKVVKLLLTLRSIEWLFNNREHRFHNPGIIRWLANKSGIRKRWWQYGKCLGGEDEDGIYWSKKEYNERKEQWQK